MATTFITKFKGEIIAQILLKMEGISDSRTLGSVKLEPITKNKELLQTYLYQLTTMPAGKLFMSLEKLIGQGEDKQYICFNDLKFILDNFEEGWKHNGLERVSIVLIACEESEPIRVNETRVVS